VSPIVHIIAADDVVVSAAAAVFRRSPVPFSDDDIALANRLVPHLRRAYRLFVDLGGVRQERLALAEVVDRLGQGVFLLDARGRVISTNRSGRQILALED